MGLVLEFLALCLFTFLILLALGGNVLVCAAVFFDRKLRRQPENLFLVSLAVSDLMVSVLVMVFAAANDLLGYWPFGQAYCQFWICLDIACSTASILNLCFIAFDRYLHISRPMKYSRYSNRGVICLAILLIWLLSLLLGAAQIIFGAASATTAVNAESAEAFEFSNLTSRTQCQLLLMPLYAIVSSFLSFFLPATIMVLLYTKLYLYARRHVRSIRAQLKQATSLLLVQLASHTALHYGEVTKNNCEGDHGDSCSPDNNNSSESCANANVSITANSNEHCGAAASVSTTTTIAATLKPDRNRNIRFIDCADEMKRSSGRSVSDQKARLTLGVIMGTFLLCWLPFFVINVWRSLFPNFFPQSVFQVVTWLGYANSTANPIIYGIFNRDFRRAFSRIVFKFFYCFEDKHKRSYFYANEI
ncbi:7 transmembrane receptor (rhodopsin family) domain-containing protein [Ditylenchus destructor]|uniref:7 transmembrane receptor (Rhodopsin family) domain-containing protein n=1 Tax=Ditylenchus destructor TaxID=166010 RepID=A0AAD4NGU3_9BILA|nr:7 transmembrane receptor (rhodopsin family) domain-containing protein [Ditylenchus destructor]